MSLNKDFYILFSVKKTLLYHKFLILNSLHGLTFTFIKLHRKELSLCRILKLSYPFIFAIRWCKFLIIQTCIVHNLKYLRSTTLGCKGMRKSEFVANRRINKVTEFHDSETIVISFTINVVRRENKLKDGVQLNNFV